MLSRNRARLLRFRPLSNASRPRCLAFDFASSPAGVGSKREATSSAESGMRRSSRMARSTESGVVLCETVLLDASASATSNSSNELDLTSMASISVYWPPSAGASSRSNPAPVSNPSMANEVSAASLVASPSLSRAVPRPLRRQSARIPRVRSQANRRPRAVRILRRQSPARSSHPIAGRITGSTC